MGITDMMSKLAQRIQDAGKPLRESDAGHTISEVVHGGVTGLLDRGAHMLQDAGKPFRESEAGKAVIAALHNVTLSAHNEKDGSHELKTPVATPGTGGKSEPHL